MTNFPEIPVRSFIWCRDSARDPHRFGVEVGDVVRRSGALNLSETVVRFDGRAWVPLSGFKPVQNETAMSKNDVDGDGAANDRERIANGDRHAFNCACVECSKADRRVDYVMQLAQLLEAEFNRQWAPTRGSRGDLWETEWRAFAQVALEFFESIAILPTVDVDITDISAGYGVSAVVRRLKRADVVARDADADVLARWMPRDFVTWYVALVTMITGPTGNSGGVDDNALPGVGRSKSLLGSAKSGSSDDLKLTSGRLRPESAMLIRSEYASMLKEGVDRRLRKIGRDLRAKLDEEEKRRTSRPGVSARRRCSGKCGKFGESDWLYCARCGGPMREEN